MNTNRPPVWIVAVVAVLLVALGLWWWLKPAPVAEGVIIVGDSVTEMSLDQLDGDLGPKHPVYIAHSGFRSTDLLPEFKQTIDKRVADGKPLEQVAILVGYNDVMHKEVDTPSLPALMDQANRFECAVWLLLPDFGFEKNSVDKWNERVMKLAKTRKNIHLVSEWREEVAKHPEYVAQDSVHPGPEGRKELTRIYHDGIRNLC